MVEEASSAQTSVNEDKSLSCNTPRKSTASTVEARLKLKTVCADMRLRIMSRAFYGWYKHYKQARTLKTHLIKLIRQPDDDDDDDNETDESNDKLIREYIRTNRPLDRSLWTSLRSDRHFSRALFYKLIYEFGLEDNELRQTVWPYLLDVFGLDSTDEEVETRANEMRSSYERLVAEWQPIEAYVREREAKSLAEITPIKVTTCDDDDSGCQSDLTESSSSMSSLSAAAEGGGKFVVDRRRKSVTSSAVTPILSSLLSTTTMATTTTNRKCDNKGKISKPKGKIRWSSPIATRNVPTLPTPHQPPHDLDLSSIIIKVSSKRI